MISQESQRQIVQTRKLAVFRDAFTSQLRALGMELDGGDLEKCQRFDALSLKLKKEFWRALGEKSGGKINKSYYSWFRSTVKGKDKI